MRTIQVNEDLRKPGRTPACTSTSRGHPGWCHSLDSCWLIRTEKTAADVRDELMELVDSSDEVATFDVTQDLWATNFSDKRTEWLKNQMGFARAA